MLPKPYTLNPKKVWGLFSPLSVAFGILLPFVTEPEVDPSEERQGLDGACEYKSCRQQGQSL